MMKNNIITALCLLILATLVRGQTNQSCPYYQPTDVSHLCDSPDWDWEISTNDPDYCKAWAGFVSGQPNSFRMGAPWYTASTEKLIAIGEAGDYTQAKGWELIKKNFGCGSQDVHFPYFILYNKYTGFTRLFVYLNGTGNYNGAMCEVSVSKSIGSSTSATAFNAQSNTYMPSPAEYLNEDGATLGDAQSAIVHRGGSNGWAVAEFTPLFDPNFDLADYENSYLRFKIYGITTSDLKIAGTSTSVTEDIRIAGKYANPDLVDGQYKFNLTGKKATKSKGGVDSYKAIKGIAEAFDKTITLIAPDDTAATSLAKAVKELVAISKDYKDPVKVTKFLGSSLEILGKVAAIGEGDKAKSILKSFKKASGLIGIAGDLLGILIPDASSSTPTYTNATITRTNINLSGTITTSVNVESINIKLPGTQQTQWNPTQPYYNCPMGLVNLKEKVKVATIEYDRTISRERSRTTSTNQIKPWKPWEYGKKTYKSYQIEEVPEIVINALSGATFIDAEIALVAKVPMSSGAFEDPKVERNYLNNKFHKNLLVREKFTQAPMAHELLHDILLPANVEVSDKKYLFVQTPFVDMNCFKGMTLNAVKEAEVFVRVIIALQTPYSSEPYIFKGDYAIEEISGIPATNSNYASNDFENVLPPYSNYTKPFEQYTVDAEITARTYPTPWSPQYSCNRCSGLTNGPQPMQSGVFHNVSHDIKTTGNVIIEEGKRYVGGSWPNRTNWVYDIEDPIVFRAGGSITFGPGFQVKSEAHFEAKIASPGHTLPACSQPNVSKADISGLCNYNNDAWKMDQTAAMGDLEQTTLYPNPTSGMVFIETRREAQVQVVNMHGEAIDQFSTDGTQELIDLSNNPAGMYMINIMSVDGHEESKKIILN